MLVLALDISTRTGWATLSRSDAFPNETPVVEKWGNIFASKSVDEFGKYPFSYLKLAEEIAKNIRDLIQQHLPDAIVIEETNKGKHRYTQKLLEFIHCMVLNLLYDSVWGNRLFYVNTSDWRKVLGIYLTKADKKNNAKINKAKKTGKSKKELGVKGRITRKHVAIRVVKDRFGLQFKQKDNDIAEAICLGAAYLLGVPICDGKK